VESVLDSKLTIGAAGVFAIAVGVAAVVYWQRPAVPVIAKQAPSARAWDGPIGPGVLNGPVREGALGIDPQLARDPHLVVDPAGHLVPDLALRTLVESSIGKLKGAPRQAALADLRAFMGAHLKGPAVQEADTIVTAYAGYLDAEELQRARERFSVPDPAGLTEREVDHLLAWQRQRAQLRERLLGYAVAKAWYEAEDADCAAALQEWRKQSAPVGEGEDADQVELHQRRIHGPALEERRNYNAQLCASKVGAGA
jgi:hypothetical protein